MCVCVRMCMCAYVYVCVCVRMCVCLCECVPASHSLPLTHTHSLFLSLSLSLFLSLTLSIPPLNPKPPLSLCAPFPHKLTSPKIGSSLGVPGQSALIVEATANNASTTPTQTTRCSISLLFFLQNKNKTLKGGRDSKNNTERKSTQVIHQWATQRVALNPSSLTPFLLLPFLFLFLFLFSRSCSCSCSSCSCSSSH